MNNLLKVKEWIFNNHKHHAGASGIDLITGKKIPYEANCSDGDFPYVNSIELEKFINKLEMESNEDNYQQTV